jgi:multidrug efflux system membrane fusion protein
MTRRAVPSDPSLPLLATLALAAGLAACSGSAPAGAPRGDAVPVRAGVVAAKDIPVTLRAIGIVEAYSTVEIKGQVNGVLQQVHFREGQDVRRGELLFTIDPRPFQAALDAARAQLTRDQVQLKTARQDVDRYKDLVAKDYVTKEEFDRIQTNSESLEATVRADEAAVQNATLELAYCSIRSPIDGRTGKLVVHAGNLIKANGDTGLVVINQLDPIYVSFSVPEGYLDEVRAEMRKDALEVSASVQGDATPARGRLGFVDNAVDSRTGTVLLKASFDNRDRRLWPGQFVDALLRLGTRPHALVVPTPAIQTGQQGRFVYVIHPDMTVDSRPVKPGPEFNGETVVEQGLSEGDRVVTDGQLRLVPGAKVAIQESPAPPGAAASPAVAGPAAAPRESGR